MVNIGRESESVEFKESTAELEDGLIAAVAMLNKRCAGELYFGVKNSGEVVGQDVGKRTITTISQAFKNHIDPVIVPTIDVLGGGDTPEYIRVRIQGTERPYAYRGDIYIRSGEENKRIPMAELRRLFQSSSDLLKESTATNQDLTFDYLEGVLRSRGFHIEAGPKFYKRYSLINGSGTFNIQAELLSDQNTMPISVVIFNGRDRSSISVRKQFTGPLIKEMLDAKDYVESLNEMKVDMSEAVRKDVNLMDSAALDEAWVNACVHNSWLLAIPPTMHMFDDRLEILSYGGKPYYQGDEEFFNGDTMPVNDSLMHVFLAAGVTEHTGHGIPIITGVYGREAFTIDNSSVKVTLRFPFERGGGKIPSQTQFILSDNESAIISVIIENPRITIDEISATTGIGRSNIAKILVSMRKRGLISRTGSRKNGTWEILDAFEDTDK